MGGSYSGALTAWTARISPGTFWAYAASSAPVEAISDYWAYFVPPEEGMPKNCSKDVNLVINYIDNVLTTCSDMEQYKLKKMFGLESLEHNTDFAAALLNGPWLWQGNQFDPDFSEGFFLWCDYIENSVNQTDKAKLPGAEGVGLEKALEGFAKWSKDYFFPDYCADTYGYYTGKHNFECLNTYNKSSPIFTDTSLANTGDRQWNWILCDWPLGYWQVGSPKDSPTTLASKIVQPEYNIRQW
jgi:hypothetical protein